MVGQFSLVPLNLDGDDLQEWTLDREESFSYNFRYSYWAGKFKGDILRSLISYLEDVEKREPFTSNVLLEEELISPPTGAENLTASDAHSRVLRAITKLKSWTREVRNVRGPQAVHGALFAGERLGFNDFLDIPYDADGMESELRCPEELKMLKLEGIYALLREPDFYSHWHARKLLFLFDKIQVKHLERMEGGEEEFLRGFMDFLKRCAPDMRILIDE